MTIGELESNLSNTQLIDVRSASEYRTGHIPGAINIPMDELESRIADLSSANRIVLTCQTGKRAAICGQLLIGKGFDLHILRGGTDEWQKSGKPLVANTVTRWSLERQVRLGAGVIVTTGLLLAKFVDPAWIYLTAFAGLGLIFAGLTNICLMGNILARMPWNRH